MKQVLLAVIILQITGCNFASTNAGPQTTHLTKVSAISDKDSSLRILTYGLPASGASVMASRDVAKKFGFSYYPVAGCVVTEDLLDSVKNENDRIYQTISRVHGEQWQERFNKQVTELGKQYEQAIGLAEKESRLISKIKELEKQEQYLSLDAKPGSSDDIIEVEAYSFRWSNEKSEKVVHLRMAVDLKRLQLNVIDDKERVYQL